MKHVASLVLSALCTSAAALSGCTSQVDPMYRGEALATISGAVSADEAGVDGLVPVLGWYNFGAPRDEEKSDAQPVLLDEVDVDGEFPNRFTMRIYDLPPDDAMMPERAGEPAAGLAMIFAADPDADWSEGFGDGEDRPEWLAGSATNYMVLYLAGASRADGPVERTFGKKLDKGYHLVDVRELTPEQRDARLACQEGAEARAAATYNEMFGTDYESSFDVPEEEYEAYSEVEEAEYDKCGGKVNMKIVPSGLDHPVQLHIGPDLHFIDWT